jgi:nucleoside-diphosphate-sugar epimerase
MQTILGANGIIATELAGSLTQYTSEIRLVSRNPLPVNPGDELFVADLTDFAQTMAAVEGSEVVYLTVGLRYNLEIWQRDWPLIIQNVAEACFQTNASLVFFDNVYMYGRVQGWMTEETPMNPNSEKGLLRARMVDNLMDLVESGKLRVLIARCADYYGPNARKSFINLLILRNLIRNKRAQWLINDQVKHSFTYTRDAGSATALLGNTPSSYNQIWHLPTDKNVMSGEEFINLFSEIFDIDPDYIVLKRWMLTMAGIFNPVISEFSEMIYQFENDYLFDCSKFDKHFDFKTTSYKQGIIQITKQIPEKN